MTSTSSCYYINYFQHAALPPVFNISRFKLLVYTHCKQWWHFSFESLSFILDSLWMLCLYLNKFWKHLVQTNGIIELETSTSITVLMSCTCTWQSCHIIFTHAVPNRLCGARSSSLQLYLAVHVKHGSFTLLLAWLFIIIMS